MMKIFLINITQSVRARIGRVKRIAFRLWHNILGIVLNAPVRNRVRKVRFVHLMFNDKFAVPYVLFLNKHFNPSEHLVLCKRFFNEYAFPAAENVMTVKTFRRLGIGDNVQLVVCHSLFDGELVDVLYEDRSLLRKSAWMIWGGDLYSAKRSEVDDYVRSHFAFIITDTDGDDVVFRDRYLESMPSVRAGYTFPVTWEMVSACTALNRKKEHICVQINNSCDKSTLEMIEVLSRFSDENLIVRTVLSYGDLKYRDEIIKKGKAKFGDRFVFQDALMSPSRYAEWMSNVDVLVLNHERQQGIGNSFLALAFGAKLYIRSTVSTYNHFMSRGIMCYDSLKIPGMTYQDFIKNDQVVAERNTRLVEYFFDECELAKLWKPVFKRGHNHG